MRIAQVAPLFESVPPRLYGGTERVVSYLTEELTRRGHDVTLFASGDSITSARLVSGCERALWRDPDSRESLPHHVKLMELVLREARRFDVIHFHSDYMHFPLLRYCPTPTVTTMHGMLRRHDLKSLFQVFPEVPLVSISDNQREPIPWANWQATVYHGLPIGLHPFRDKAGDYLLFLGRISRDKRLDRAIEIALRSARKLKVAARICDEDRSYYQGVIEPLLRASQSFVEFIGEVGGREKDELIGNAYALLFPIDWREPFGLVMIEALACGTPVIAWRNGSVPEIIDEGRTGFIVDNIHDAVRAVGNAGHLNRAACRASFADRFDAACMASNYERVYHRLIQDPRSQTDGARSAALHGEAPAAWRG